MAYTVSRNKTVFGNMKVHILSCTADATTQTINTHLNYVYGVAFSPVSMTTLASLHIWPNKGAEATALVGKVGVSGFTSADEFILVCFGK